MAAPAAPVYLTPGVTNAEATADNSDEGEVGILISMEAEDLIRETIAVAEASLGPTAAPSTSSSIDGRLPLRSILKMYRSVTSRRVPRADHDAQAYSWILDASLVPLHLWESKLQVLCSRRRASRVVKYTQRTFRDQKRLGILAWAAFHWIECKPELFVPPVEDYRGLGAMGLQEGDGNDTAVGVRMLIAANKARQLCIMSKTFRQWARFVAGRISATFNFASSLCSAQNRISDRLCWNSWNVFTQRCRHAKSFMSLVLDFLRKGLVRRRFTLWANEVGLVQERESTGLDDDFVPLLSISFDVDLEVSKLNVVDKRRKNPWARLEGTVSHSKNVPSKKLTTVERLSMQLLFRHWRRYCSSRTKLKMLEKQARRRWETTLQLRVFCALRSTLVSARCARLKDALAAEHYRKRLLSKTFHDGMCAYLMARRLRRLYRWKAAAQGELVLKRRALLQWKRFIVKCKEVAMRYGRERALRRWRAFAKLHAIDARRENRATSRIARRRLRFAVRQWRTFARVHAIDARREKRAMRTMRRRQLRRAVGQWRRSARTTKWMRRRRVIADGHHARCLKLKSFRSLWKLVVAMKRFLKTLLGKAFVAWKTVWYNAKVEWIAQQEMTMFRMRRAITGWARFAKARIAARRRDLLHRIMQQWQARARAEREYAVYAHEYTKKAMQLRLLRIILDAWYGVVFR
eukprot:g4196.t1